LSRSRKKTPITGITTARSEKQDKRLANRKLRRKTRQALRCRDLDVLPVLREVSNVWCMDKDGKFWFGDYPRRDATLPPTSWAARHPGFYAKYYVRLMRK
jgi:hypothetical protein